MRYITQYDQFCLFTDAGNVAYQFEGGVLDLGSGVIIDATLKSGTDNSLQMVFPADLSGVALTASGFSRLEGAGQGNLITTASGLVGNFYEAPTLTATTNAVAAIWGTKYKVLSGTVAYAGTTYNTNEVFFANGTTTATTGTGTFALEVPEILKQTVDQHTKPAFELAHLNSPNDVTGYWGLSNDGFLPNNSLVTTDVNSYFKIQPD